MDEFLFTPQHFDITRAISDITEELIEEYAKRGLNITIGECPNNVFVDNNEISLTRKEFELLYLLATNKEMVFNKEHIYNKIWGEDMYGDMNTVTVHIKRLREKIEKKPSEPVHIQTVWGIGYKFIA